MRKRTPLSPADVALHQAAIAGDLAAAREAVAAGAGVSSQDVEHASAPLQWAAAFGHADVARFLLDAGADVNAVDENGDAPLSSAVLNGHAPVVRLLLDGGADVNAEDGGGSTPLLVAIMARRTALLPLLLAAGSDVNFRRYNGSTPLMEAAEAGDPGTVHLLVEAGADPAQTDDDGRTAADYARAHSRAEAATYLTGLRTCRGRRRGPTRVS